MAKVMISMPDDLLARVDAEVRLRETTRSALLRSAVSRELGTVESDEVAASIARTRARTARHGRPAGLPDAATVIREGRDILDRRDRTRLRRVDRP